MPPEAASEQVVTVFGSGDPRPGSPEYEAAREAGAILAECGFAVANGAYGGTMEASARGAKEAGGTTIGVPCSIWKTRPNEYVDRIIQTHSHTERLATLIDLGTAGYVVMPGATGTLTELASVWEYAAKGFFEAGPRRIVCVGKFWQPLVRMMTAARASVAEFVTVIGSPPELKTIFAS
jgi:uncharacterized protein (TIGR00725 family)